LRYHGFVPRSTTSLLPRLPAESLRLDVDPEIPLLRIQEVADLVGLTARSIRYYEEIGLLKPAARSEGAYRLYDADDVARLQFIKGLRDDAGFSLAEIGQLLEDETARATNRTRFRASTSIAERRAVLHDGIVRIDRQVATLRGKIARLESMIDAADERRRHLQGHIAELDADGDVRPHRPTRA
jgi:MerR family transcriptional regulator, repressor of the yfmOP operon